MLCELSIKTCSKNGNVFIVSLLKVEQDLQTALAGHMLTIDLSVILCEGKKTPHKSHGCGHYEMKLETTPYPEGTCSPAILTRIFSLRSWLMHLLAVQEKKKKKKVKVSAEKTLTGDVSGVH